MSQVTGADGRVREVSIEVDILQDHRRFASENRALLDRHGLVMVDVMGSIGAGKTSVIEQLVCHLRNDRRIVVLNGDLATTIDQDRILRHGVDAIQVNTGRECHLDAPTVRSVLDRLDLESLDLVLVENVGNLICPADFPLGSDHRVVVTSVTEGPYVIEKHPHVFAEIDVVVVNKIDLASVMGVDVGKIAADVARVNPAARVFLTNARDGTGIPELAAEIAEARGGRGRRA